MRLISLAVVLAVIVYSLLFFADPNEQVFDSGEVVQIEFINSTPATQKVSLTHVLDDGSFSDVTYVESVAPGQTGLVSIQVGVYNFKVKNLTSGDVEEVHSYPIGKHLYVNHEMRYYLDLSLNRNFVVAEINNVNRSSFDKPKFKLFKVYDGSKPFQLARRLKDEDRVFLCDTSKNVLTYQENFYGITPIVKGLNEIEVEKYLSKQIRMLYK